MITLPCQSQPFHNAILDIRRKYNLDIARRAWTDEYDLIIKEFLEQHNADLLMQDYVFKHLIFNNEQDLTVFLLKYT